MNTLILKFVLRSVIARPVQYLRYLIYHYRGGDIHPTVIMERNLNLDRLYPQGIHIGKHTLIASQSTILCHDHSKRVNGQPMLADVRIGERCFIAVGAIILPGITIGNEVIVGAGAVVTKDVPSNCIVAGNPATIIRTGIRMNDKAELINWNEKDGWTE